MRLMIELDTGETVPLDSCQWVLRDPCGCARGVSRASFATTEDEAWKEFYNRKRGREAAKRRGCSMELMTHKRYVDEVSEQMRLTWVCPHEQVNA